MQLANPYLQDSQSLGVEPHIGENPHLQYSSIYVSSVNLCTQRLWSTGTRLEEATPGIT